MRLLGSHVARRPGDPQRRAAGAGLDDRPGPGARRATRARHREPEVGDLRAPRDRRDQHVVRLEIAVEHVAQVGVVDAARDVADPAHRLPQIVGPAGRRRRAGLQRAGPRIVLADQLHHDVRRLGVVDVEHPDHVLAGHLARRAGLGEDLLDRRGPGVEHLDRHVAAQLAVVGPPHRGGRPGVEPHAGLVARAVAEHQRVAIGGLRALGAEPDQQLARQLGVVGEPRAQRVRPVVRGPLGELAEGCGDRRRGGGAGHSSPHSMPCSTAR